MRYKKQIGLLLLFCLGDFNVSAYETPHSFYWQLHVVPLKSPLKWKPGTSFSQACYQSIKARFDTTSYQAVLSDASATIDTANSKKRDIVIEGEKPEAFAKGKVVDTLIVWAKFRTGFKYSRITVPFKKDSTSTLPDSLASAVYRTLCSDFLTVLSLEGGPRGCVMKISDIITVTPPTRIYLPFGEYAIVTSYPNFTTRFDSISINPGENIKKRVLLLPSE